MEGEKIFYPEKREEPKNLLLEGPELVSPEEERKQEGEMSFSFSSDTRRYYLGHKDGKPFFMVEYFDSLPDELSEEEKERFTKETRKQGEVEKNGLCFETWRSTRTKRGIGRTRPKSKQKISCCSI